jgi:hypothetical protein
VAVLEQVGVVGHGVGLTAVVKVVAAGVREFGGHRRDEGSGGTLLCSLVGKGSRCLGFGQVVLLLLREVPLQPGGDTARVDGVGDDAVVGPAARGFDRELRGGGLGLRVGRLRIVITPLELKVVEHDR